MASLIDNYEQQYAVLTADITAQIGRLRIAGQDEKKNLIVDIDKHVDEAKELLEQMDLEVRDAEILVRPRLRSRLDCYRAELKRLGQEFNKAKTPIGGHIGYDLLDEYTDNSVTEDQKRRLLDNSDRIERTGKRLDEGYRIALETENIGTQVLQDLNLQRETIQQSRARLRQTDAELGLSNRLLSGMQFRSLQQRLVLLAVALTFVIVISLSIYFSFTK